MKKWVIVFLLLAASTAYAGYYFTPQSMPAFMHPEGRACSRMAALCGSSPTECEDAFTELRQLGGPASIRKPISCVMSAESCAESAGCLAGGGVNAVLNAGEQLLKGMRKSVGE